MVNVMAVLFGIPWILVTLLVYDDARGRELDNPVWCAVVVFVSGGIGMSWYLLKIRPDEAQNRIKDGSTVVLPSASKDDSASQTE
jgi:hypothetical protein